MTRASRRSFLAQAGLATLAGPALLASRSRAEAPSRTKNVILVTLDGFRPEEMFGGADAAFLNKQSGVEDVPRLRGRFWRETPEARRAALLPFFWGTIARQGQILGNEARGSVVRVTNGRNFSYPGYNEILTGAPDDRIDSNDKRPNPNVTVLERLNRRDDFRGKVAAFGSWDVFPYIVNEERSGVPVNAGWESIEGDDLTPVQRVVNAMNADLPRHWEGVRYDALTFAAALEHLRRGTPRVLYLALGETDDYAHEGRYDLYLDSAFRSDAMLGRLWAELQAHPEYRDSTAMIVTTDHGRGGPPDGWRSHGSDVKGSDRIWIAAIGPHVPALGERADCETATQSQVAGTVAAMLGVDLGDEASGMAPPVAELLGPSSR